MTTKAKISYEVGKLYSVATSLLLAASTELRARFSTGNNMFATKLDIEATGQSIPCGVQLLTAKQQADNPGKVFLLTEGFIRLDVAEALHKDLSVLVHAPYTDAQIFERNVSANGPKSDLSPMDINAIILRGLKLGFADAEMKKKLAFVAGRGKSELGEQRYTQYSRLNRLPAEVQLMVHDGRILLSAALHMTNRTLTEAQYERLVSVATDSRAREAKEQYEADAVYIKRESDAAKKAAMAGELPKVAPPYTPKVRAKGVVSPAEPITREEISKAEEELGIKAAKPAVTVGAPGTPLSTEEWLHLAQQVRERGGVMIEVGNAIEGVTLRKISEAEFCSELEAIMLDGGGTAHRIRREVAEKLGKPQTAKPVARVGRRATDAIPLVPVSA